MRFTSAVVEPTAARECSLAKLPTTIISAALSWSTLESISGSDSRRSFGSIAPVVISIDVSLRIVIAFLFG